MRRMAGGRFRQTVGQAVLRAAAPLLYAVAFIWRRLLFATTFVAVTGSLGKTTAKESMARVLRARYRVFASHAEQNANALLALNVLRVRPWHRIAVLETATSEPGKLAFASRLLRPDLAVILKVARTHTLNYGSLEAIADEKWQIGSRVRKGGKILVNGDDPLLAARETPPGVRRVTFGTADGCDLRASDICAAWPDRLSLTVHYREESARVETGLVGSHWTSSVLSTIAVCLECGFTLQAAAAASRLLTPFPARMQPVRLPSGAIVIRDEYNGSVDSYLAALHFLSEAKAERRILIATGYTDTKERAAKRILNVARDAAKICDVAVFVGDHCTKAARAAIAAGMSEAQVRSFVSLAALARFLGEELKAGDLVVIKGRTTDHLSRAVLAQFGELKCWDPACKRRLTCDFCWRLGLGADQLTEMMTL